MSRKQRPNSEQSCFSLGVHGKSPKTCSVRPMIYEKSTRDERHFNYMVVRDSITARTGPVGSMATRYHTVSPMVPSQGIGASNGLRCLYSRTSFIRINWERTPFG
ncbi:hypothetical protein TNCV_2173221 [Trichonephila clavipes]|nr:hypothetical protein TNCV_2173221 [Trichonephila clavipes]